VAAELIFPFGRKHPLPTPAAAELLTRRYRDLRGLEAAPFWVWLCVTNTVTALDLLLPVYSQLLTLLLLILGISGQRVIRRYLDHRFGVVRQPRQWLPIVFFVGFLLFQWSRFASSRDFMAPALGLASAYVTWRDFRLRRHWLVPTVVCAVLSLRLPVLAPADPHFQIVFSARIAVIAAAFCLAHLLDHRALVKIFEQTDVS